MLPVEPSNLPAGQSSQALAAVMFWDVPAGQSSQASDPSAANVPAAHAAHALGAHCAASPFARPASHGSHAEPPAVKR